MSAGSGDTARVDHFLTQQEHIAPALVHGLGGMCANMRTSLHLNLALRIGKGRRVGILAVQAFGELLVADRGRCRHQIAYIHLQRTTEHHPVLVHHHDRAITLDRTLDLARCRVCSHYTVQHGIGGFLLELHRGVATHVKAFPVQHRFAVGLLDSDIVLAFVFRMDRPFGSSPDMQIACSITVPHPALHVAVRYTGLFGSGLTRGFLGGLLGCNGTGSTTQIFYRTGQLLASFGMLACCRVQ